MAATAKGTASVNRNHRKTSVKPYGVPPGTAAYLFCDILAPRELVIASTCNRVSQQQNSGSIKAPLIAQRSFSSVFALHENGADRFMKVGIVGLGRMGNGDVRPIETKQR